MANNNEIEKQSVIDYIKNKDNDSIMTQLKNFVTKNAHLLKENYDEFVATVSDFFSTNLDKFKKVGIKSVATLLITIMPLAAASCGNTPVSTTPSTPASTVSTISTTETTATTPVETTGPYVEPYDIQYPLISKQELEILIGYLQYFDSRYSPMPSKVIMAKDHYKEPSYIYDENGYIIGIKGYVDTDYYNSSFHPDNVDSFITASIKVSENAHSKIMDLCKDKMTDYTVNEELTDCIDMSDLDDDTKSRLLYILMKELKSQLANIDDISAISDNDYDNLIFNFTQIDDAFSNGYGIGQISITNIDNNTSKIVIYPRIRTDHDSFFDYSIIGREFSIIQSPNPVTFTIDKSKLKPFLAYLEANSTETININNTERNREQGEYQIQYTTQSLDNYFLDKQLLSVINEEYQNTISSDLIK